MANLSLYVDTEESTGSWDTYGSPPYLSSQNQPTDYISDNDRNNTSGIYSFQGTSESGSINSVTLYIYAVGAAVDDFEAYLDAGQGSGMEATGLGCPLAWGWVSIEVTSILPGWTEINAAQLQFTRKNTTDVASVDCAYLYIDYDAPTTAAPTTEPPTSPPPTTPPPTTVPPTTEPPSSPPPTTAAPTTIPPTTEPPTTVPPTSEPPTTVPPTSEPPSSPPPTTAAPTTLAPTSLAPTSLAPTSLAPTSLAPTSLAPTSLAPTTLEPTTVPPTTCSPTTYTEDFSGASPLDDWTEVWNGADFALSIEAATQDAQVGASNLRFTGDAGSSRRYASYDPAGVSEDQEVLILVDIADLYGTDQGLRIFLRASGSVGNEYAYFLNLNLFSDDFFMGKYMSGISSNVGTVDNTFDVSSLQVPVWIRFQVIGTNLKAKIWPYFSFEPVEWCYEATDSGISSGSLGLGQFNQETYDVMYFAAGTCGASPSVPALTTGGDPFRLTHMQFTGIGNGVNWALLFPYRIGSDADGHYITDIKVYWMAGNEDVRLALYKGSDPTDPTDAVLVEDLGLVTPQGVAYVDYPLSSAEQVSSGDIYYIGMKGDTGNTSIRYITSPAIGNAQVSNGSGRWVITGDEGNDDTEPWSASLAGFSPSQSDHWWSVGLVLVDTPPSTAAPTTAPPTTHAATTAPPTTPHYTTTPPSSPPPSTPPPTTAAPTTAPPTTKAPTTAAPTTLAPTSLAPTSLAPTSLAPTSLAPTSLAPTTAAPTTAAPTSVPPTTVPCGCDATNIYTKNLTFSQTDGDYNRRIWIVPGNLSDPSCDPNWCRIAFKAGTSTLNLNGASIGELDTEILNGAYKDGYTRITFDGGSNTVVIPGGETKWSDWINFSIDSDLQYLIHMYYSGDIAYTLTPTGDTTFYKSTSDDDTMDQTLSSYSWTSSAVYGVTNIEIAGDCLTTQGFTTSLASTAPPTTAPPTTAAPTSLAPTTVAPTSLAPTSLAPTSLAPTTVAPTTLGPTTEDPYAVGPFDDYDDDDYFDNSTNVRFIIPAGEVKKSGSLITVSLAYRASSWSFSSLYIGHPAAVGDAYDFDGNQRRVTFNGGNHGGTVGPGGLDSDEIYFNLDETKDVILAFYFSTADYTPVKTSTSGYDLYYKITSDESPNTDVTDYIQHGTYYLRRFIKFIIADEALTSPAPSTEPPTTPAPTTKAPTTPLPTTKGPTSAPPTTPRPTTAVPSTAAPTSLGPTTSAPTTSAPTTIAPTTTPPTTVAPTTAAPTSLAPTTEAGSTSVPTTVPPTTVAPSTVSPSTVPPSTVVPPTTVLVSTSVPTTNVPEEPCPKIVDGKIVDEITCYTQILSEVRCESTITNEMVFYGHLC